IIFAGLGQFYNRRWIKGSIFVIVELLFIVICGQFVNDGICGLRTLGTIPGEHHSLFLIIFGLISLILLGFALTLYVLNIIDAKNDAVKIVNGEEKRTIMEALRHTWDRGFPYVFVTPGLIMLLFIVVLPLMFTVALAFTDYNLYNS